jgi:hypothetical protein
VNDELRKVFASILGIRNTLEYSIEEIRSLIDPGQDLHAEQIEFLTFAARRAPLSSAPRLQDLWVLFELGEKRNGYFVEFGASDGAAISNTALLERFYGWQGAIAEPAPSRNDRLRATRNCYITNRFIYQTDGLKILLNEVERSDDGGASGAPGGRGQTATPRTGKRYEAETLSLRSFLRAAEAPATIDYLNVKVEDDTLNVLRDFDFSDHAIKLLSFAYSDPRQGEAVADVVARNGYRARFKEFSLSDDWYVKEEHAAAAQPAAA